MGNGQPVSGTVLPCGDWLTSMALAQAFGNASASAMELPRAGAKTEISYFCLTKGCYRDMLQNIVIVIE